MKHIKKIVLSFFVLILIGGLISACDPKTVKKDKKSSQSENKESKMRKYKDHVGHKVEIPVSPKRVVFHGENFGDLLTINVDAIGGSSSWIKDHIYADRVKNVQDLGFPISVEKTLELKPDLIIVGDTDEKLYDKLSKIAPTIVFDTFAPLDKRLTELGDIFGKEKEAKKWLKDYNNKAENMWKKLIDDGTIKPDETATVLTYYPGNRLFVMASTGLSQFLYHPNGFKPGEKIQKFLDEEVGFQEISTELLPEYSADRIFILNPLQDEAVQSTKEMMKSSIWKSIPAVKKGNVYSLDILKSSSDASTREWLINEIPKMLKK